MTLHLGYVPAGSTLYIPFHTFNSSGASVTISGLATSDIEIYKNGGATTRASDNGYALLDTDGIDFASKTGIHGFSIDLSDNSDASFYAAGSTYWVVISAITVDSQTVSFVAATFFIGPIAANVSQLLGTAWLTPGTAGTPDVNVKLISADATAADNAEAFFDGTGYAGTNNVIPTVTTTGTATAVTTVNGLAANVITAASIATGAIDADAIADGAIDAGAIAADAITAAKIADGAIDAATFAANAITSTVLANDAITAAKLHTDVTTELQNGLATQVSVDDLPTNAELATALGTADDATLAQIALVKTEADKIASIKTKTDSLTFTVAGKVDSNITHVIADPVQVNGATDTNWGGAP